MALVNSQSMPARMFKTALHFHSRFSAKPYSKSLLNKTKSLRGSILGLSAEEPLVSILLLTYWKSADDDEKIKATIQSTLEAISKGGEGRGTKTPFVYLNYAASFQDPIGSYGEESGKFLREISKK